MLDSPILSNNLAKTLETTRTHKIRKQSNSGEKEEFFEKVQEKMKEKEKNNDDDFYRSDEVDVSSIDGDEEMNDKKEINSSANKADKDLPGSTGKSIDIKV